MSTIDEIMDQADDYARAWADARTSNIGYRSVGYAYFAEEQVTLRAILTQSLAEARAEGERETRELCATVCDTTPPHPFRPSIEAAHAIRALPLPTGERQAVRLTDERLDALADEVFDLIQDEPDDDVGDRTWDRMFGRAIETAALAANGLTT